MDITGLCQVGKKTDKACDCCEKKASHVFRVRDGWYVGDSDTYIVCPRHLSIAKQRPGMFFNHYRSKDKYIKEIKFQIMEEK